MRLKIISLGTLVLTALCVGTVYKTDTDVTQQPTQTCPLIPRQVLFDNPEKFNVRISPDGTKLAYLAPDKNNVLNIWVRSVDKNDDVCISKATGRGIFSYWWAYDMRAIFYAYDKDGKENTHLYAIDLATGASKNLTPYDDVMVDVIAYHREHPTRMLVQMNKDDKRFFDVYELDLITGALTFREKNPGCAVGFMADHDLNIRAALCNLPDGGSKMLLKQADGSWQSFITWTLEDGYSHPYTLSRDGKTLYALDSRDSDTLQLVRIDIANKQKTIIASQPGYDITEVVRHPDTDEPIFAINSKDHDYRMIIDHNFDGDVQALDALKVPWEIASTTTDLQTWIIATTSDTQVANYYVYHRPTKKITFLYCARPALANYQLQPMQCVDITSRDGLVMHSYLTLPYSNATNVPMVLFVHGGPWAADQWGYNSRVQLLANRGYAVLQVNYRGSSDYGKAFLNAGNKEWGGKMHDDLIDAVNWAIAHHIADPARIAIIGGSYGGYAALAGAAFTPDTFCCAVDLFGICNLFTRMSHAAPYLAPWIANLCKRVGDPVADEAMMRARSPLFSAHRIKKPMLIVQGANDVRCTMVESQQIVAELKKNGIEHDYLVFQGEGHGLAKPENNLIMYAAIEKFLAKHLGGRCEPLMQ